MPKKSKPVSPSATDSGTRTLQVSPKVNGRCPMSGSKSEQFATTLANQTLGSLWLANSNQETREKQIGGMVAALIGISPEDELEGMLSAQMFAAHNAAMECYRRAMISEQTFEGRSENLSQANKLSRSYATMMEALARYRGKGQQKMTVEHVHVHAGGQAIVGNVTRPEGGATLKKEEQPRAKQIDHAPIETMSCSNPLREAMPVASHAER